MKIDRIPDTKQQWFKEAKYGLFIHWGLYSLLAGEYKGKKTDHISEWIMNSLGIPVEEYEKLAEQFNPDHFDADELVRRAKEDWGMKYIVFTSKHHEGFAMYHSQISTYNVVDATPCHRDIVKELADACRKYGIKFGLYYSQAQDWHDPNGYVSHAMKTEEQLQDDNTKKDFQSYLDNKVKPQLREILTQYGEICLIWFDTPMGMTKEQSQECIDLVKSIQPNCIISGRIGNQLGDYMTTGDNFIPRLPYEGDWEVPATMNDTWGYNKDDHNWKDADSIIRLLVKINSRGGNYLLNIGPKGNGEIPQESIEILDKVGKYVTENSEGIFATEKMDIYPYELDGVEFTCKKNRLYVHVFKPMKRLEILNCANHVDRAYLLRDGRDVSCVSEISCEGDPCVSIEFPRDMREQKNYCICLELEEEKPVFEPLRG
ncbi:alpha-L-fucosidase [Mediterraneibacter glycyrrhizinilyticus]|uniref:alpha-L-fucosidase n=1 Tax=Mediterraneibacter glycyrrhizinilyticus TaxID=342942 RepID=UPI001A9C34F1|nr:alpha-L-fucosidase [Mediterraneibacter glycyrrhizinilyticus]